MPLPDFSHMSKGEVLALLDVAGDMAISNTTGPAKEAARLGVNIIRSMVELLLSAEPPVEAHAQQLVLDIESRR